MNSSTPTLPSSRPPSLDEELAKAVFERDKRKCERSLYEFVKQAWPAISRRPYKDNWHIKVICEFLERIFRRQFRRGVINVPPRCMKSLLVDVFWPSWMWIHEPQAEIMNVSHKQALAIRDTVKSRRLLQSPWFQTRWGDRFMLASDQNQKMRYENDHGGVRLAQGMDSGITGEGGDIIVVDDPHDRKQAHSEAERTRALETFDEEISTRLNDPGTGAIIIIMQRLHVEDLTGHVLAGEEKYEHLMLPMEFEQSRADPRDPRKQEGELLWPERFTPTAVDSLKTRLAAYGTAGQLQQRPAPKGGGVWKVNLIRFYDRRPEHFDALCQAWDMNFKETEGGSFVVGQVWGRRGADFFLLDEVRGRWGFAETKQTMLNLSARWPQVLAKLVEDKANGPAIMDELRHTLPGLIAVDTGRDSKVARAESQGPLIESGNVYLPKPGTTAVDTDDWLVEAAHFPQEPNDRVDCATHALKWLNGSNQADAWKQAMFEAASERW